MGSSLSVTIIQRRAEDLTGYTKGEKIFVKINQGTARWLLSQDDKDNGYFYPAVLPPEEKRVRTSIAPTETNPYVVLEILRELVNEKGISQQDIVVGDPMIGYFRTQLFSMACQISRHRLHRQIFIKPRAHSYNSNLCPSPFLFR